MHLLCVLALPLLGLVLAQIPPLNTSQVFYVRTQVRPGQTGKEAFENLWLYAYHTGAGTNDAMLSSNKSHAARSSLNASALRPPSGRTLYGLVLDLNTPGIPWSAAPNRGANTYSAWQPVGINAGNGAAANNSAFYLDDNGLQWTDAAGGGSAEGFGGWLVCKWWHPDIDGSTPGLQLFFRLSFYPKLVLETCADVFLKPEYI